MELGSVIFFFYKDGEGSGLVMEREIGKRLGEVLIAILGFYLFAKEVLVVGIISYFAFRVVYSFSERMDFRELFSSLDMEKRREQFLNCILVCLLMGVGLEGIFAILNGLFKSVIGIDNMGLCLAFGGGVIVTDMLVRLFNDYLSFQNSDRFCKGIMRGYRYGAGGLFIILFIVLGTHRAEGIAILFMPFMVMGIVMLAIMGKKIKWKGGFKVSKRCINKIGILINESVQKGMGTSYIYGLFFMGASILLGVLPARYGYSRAEVISSICGVYLFYMAFVGLFSSQGRGTDREGMRGFYVDFRRGLLLGAFFMLIMDAVIFVVYGERISFGMMGYLALLMVSMRCFRGIFRDFGERYGSKARKIREISIFSGALVKGILEVPLMSTFIRMGQSAIYGDILSSVIALTLGNVLGLIYIVIRQRVSLNELTINIINSLYECVVVCVIFTLLRMCIPISSNRVVLVLEIVLYMGIVMAMIRGRKWLVKVGKIKPSYISN